MEGETSASSVGAGYGSPNSYWKLPLHDYHYTTVKALKERLQNEGYRIVSSFRKSILVALAQKSDRGLPCYDGCTMDELVKFATDRGVLLSGKPTTKAIAEALKHEDTQRTFDRFNDLSAELRVRVYSFHMAGVPQMLLSPTQPPIARTCKLVRSESLPVFYSECNFAMITGHAELRQERLGRFSTATRMNNLTAARGGRHGRLIAMRYIEPQNIERRRRDQFLSQR
ncbi:hypothetical protein LTR08_003386 [Meristemomyces frigidus]|nr:hypothetical protein LTR08_003386 [Meristemomyces frigidus]